MVEVCFASLIAGSGRMAGKTVLRCCPALPYEYARRQLDTPVQVVVLQEDRFIVLGPVPWVLDDSRLVSPVAAASAPIV